MSIAAASAHPLQAISLMAERQQQLQLNSLSIGDDGSILLVSPNGRLLRLKPL